jgi:hypothetical protein
MPLRSRLWISAFLALGTYAWAAHAGEYQPGMRVAERTATANVAEGRRPADGTALDADLRLLLAHNGPPAQAKVKSAGDIILVAFGLSTPQSIDVEVAEQHGLELIDSAELPSFGLRIVRYRARDGRPTEPILARLRGDSRIASAQAIVAYQLPEAGRPATEVGRVKGRPAATQQAKRRDMPVQSARHSSGRRTATVSRIARKLSAGSGMIVDDGAPSAGGPTKSDRPLASANHMALRFPTADEPFVNIGGEGR